MNLKKLALSLSIILINTTGCAMQDNSATLSGSHQIQKEALAAHNQWRVLHHAPNLIWDKELANYAQKYAKKCWFKHSSSPYGENLAAGFSSISLAVNTWYKEHTRYSYDKPGFSMSTGHFTQVVWKSSKKLGCAYAICDGRNGTPGTFWVCEYSPAGNVTNKGFFAANVLAS